MKDVYKAGIGVGIVAAAGIIGYEAVNNITNPAASIETTCQHEQTTLFNKWLSLFMEYSAQDSKEGIGITVEQQSQLNTITSELDSLQASCASEISKVNKSAASVAAEIGGIVATGIAVAIVIYGLGKAAKQVKSRKKPPSAGGGITWEEAQAYLLPIMIQDMYNNNTINTNMAEALSTYATNVLGPSLTSSSQSQLNTFNSISAALVDELAIIAGVATLTALISLSAAAISLDIEIAAAIAIAA